MHILYFCQAAHLDLLNRMAKRWTQIVLFAPPFVTFLIGVYGAYKYRFDPAFAKYLPAVSFYVLTGVATSLFFEVIVRRFSAETDLADKVSEVIERHRSLFAAGFEKALWKEDRIDSFIDIANSASSSVSVLGVAFTNVSSRRGIAQLRSLLNTVPVRILLPDPSHLRRNPALKTAIEHALDRKSDIAAEIENAIAEFTKLSNSLTQRNRNRFQVRMHTTIPTMNLKIVDNDASSATLLVEIFPYRCAFHGRLRLRLTPSRDQQGWYEHLAQSFEDLWDDSTDAF